MRRRAVPFCGDCGPRFASRYYRCVAKFKPAKGRKPATRPPQGALSCVILVIAGMVLVMLFLYYVMRNANG